MSDEPRDEAYVCELNRTAYWIEIFVWLGIGFAVGFAVAAFMS